MQAAATLGSITGVFLTGFGLISWFGVRHVIAGVAVNIGWPEPSVMLARAPVPLVVVALTGTTVAEAPGCCADTVRVGAVPL